jgi:predicted NBD/HSP70 family sugar kinase
MREESILYYCRNRILQNDQFMSSKKNLPNQKPPLNRAGHVAEMPILSMGSPTRMREVNRSILLTLIRQRQPVSRLELAKQTGFSCSNVSEIVEELVRDGLVVEKKSKSEGRGRAPIHLFINEAGYPVLGVSIRPTRTTIVFSGLGGNIRNRTDFPTPTEPVALVKKIQRYVQALFRADLKGSALHKIGISVPGTVDAAAGRVLFAPTLPAYCDFDLAGEISRLTGVPTLVENDCNLGAFAELWLSGVEVLNLDSFVFVEIGDLGVGGGIIMNREVFRGHDQRFSGEFGHMVLDPQGAKCGCGRHGCWEMFVCDRATCARYDHSEAFNPDSMQRLIRLAAKGDLRALSALKTTAEYLSAGLSNIVCALNPQVIILSGEITTAWEQIGSIVLERFATETIHLEIRLARLTAEELFLHGAVAVALSSLFGRPKLGILSQYAPPAGRRDSAAL